MNLRVSALVLLSSVLLSTGCPPSSPPAVTNPTPPATAAPAPAATTDAPPAAAGKVAAAEWCVEHGVPEAVCTRCHADLIASFKAKKDWCEEHALPESQCIKCNPGVEAKWKAMAPDSLKR